MLAWQLYRNLENSLKDFLDAKVILDSVTDINGVNVPIRVGRKNDSNWSLPCITVYFESETSTRFELGSNNTLDLELMIIDIFATNEGERIDLAHWVKETIKDGFTYYSYTPNESDPQNPTKVAGDLTTVDFITNTRVSLGVNVDPIDAHRHRISIQVDLNS